MQQLTNLLDNGLRQALGRLRAPAIAVESIVIGFVIGFGSLGSSPLRFGQRYVAIGHRLETQVLKRLHTPQQIGHERDAAHLNDELVGDAAVAHHVIAEQQYDDGQHQQALPHLLVLQVGIVVAQPSAVLPHGAHHIRREAHGHQQEVALHPLHQRVAAHAHANGREDDERRRDEPRYPERPFAVLQHAEQHYDGQGNGEQARR